jgi:ribonuclease J
MIEPEALHFLALGGSGEIGMNLNLYACRGSWIMVDLGVTFADETLPGIDLVLPDPAFIEGERENLLGIILTHAHEDHIGAVGHLWPRLRCPVYATPFTAELLKSKLYEAGILDEVPLHVVPLGGTVTLGPFEAEFVALTHSIPEPNALRIKTPFGTIMHTGDWKLDPDPLVGEPVDAAALNQIGADGVRAIVCDSTNVFYPGHSGSESEVETSLKSVIAPMMGRVAVTTFASNVARLGTICKVAHELDRHVVLVGRSMLRVVAAARATGHLDPSFPLLAPEDAAYLPRDKVLYLCTGSQGEPRGATARIATGESRDVVLEEGDTVIFSSKIIPGNEVSLGRVHNLFADRGINVVTEKDEFVHVSGHPNRDELIQMYHWIRPELAIPVHGEIRHLEEHARLARELQVPEVIAPRNGMVIRIAPGRAEAVGQVPTGRLVLDGTVVVPVESASVVERRRLMYNGHVVVTLVADRKGEVIAPPGIVTQGLPQPDGEADTAEMLSEAAESAIGALKGRDRRDPATISEAARVAVRRACRDQFGKRPVVNVQLTTVH